MIELILLLLLSVLVVFISSLLFVNSIDFLGGRYNVGGSFTGAILSPLFTSFPELIVLLVAIFGFGGPHGATIGVGTIFGEPFMVSSLSYGLVGILVLIGFFLKRREHKFLEVSKTLAIPFLFVTILFPLALVPSLISAYYVRYLFGIIFLFSYVGYVAIMYRRRSLEPIENAEVPYLSRILPFKEAGGFIQLGVSVVILYFAARQMVGLVYQLATGLGISLMGLAIIVIPAATAIPETSSALIWGFRGKDTMSMSSLVGEKVLYTTLFPGLALLLIPWVLDVHAYLSVLGTSLVSLLMLFFISKKKIPWYGLTFGLIFFIAYAVVTFGLRI
jgi:cation:H+ antiporter